ncbi:MAG: hypothetical protein Q4C47_01345 [Planctomycetia bacterium]|nr:hypothetical protein [Planctomycetia bacterium]
MRRFLKLLVILGIVGLGEQATAQTYAIVVPESIGQDAGWNEVARTLAAKQTAMGRTVRTISWKENVPESLGALREIFPEWICFVVPPELADRDFVATVHRVTRDLDDDPYTDSYWGILTGYDAENALRIAKRSDPLVIRRGLGGTSFALSRFEEGVWYSESVRNEMESKEKGSEPVRTRNAPDDTTRVLAESLPGADFFVTSGHATQRNWEIGYAYRNGEFRCRDGHLFGRDTMGVEIPIHATTSRVFLAVGNCLMGDIDGRDAMALAFLNSGGVDQMIGYTVPTWYGYGGWGVLDYFVEQPGRFSLAESFFAANQAIVFRLERYFPGTLEQVRTAERTKEERVPIRLALSEDSKSAGLTQRDAVGLLYDLDTVAFYGDPGWDARLAAQPLDWDQTLSSEPVDGDPETKTYTLEIVANRENRENGGIMGSERGGNCFALVDTNGSQRGGRPLFVPFPERVDAQSVTVTEGAELRPVITDRFLMVAQPSSEFDRGDGVWRIRFTARSPE